MIDKELFNEGIKTIESELIDFSYPQKGLLVNFEKTQHPWAFQDQGKIYSYI